MSLAAEHRSDVGVGDPAQRAAPSRGSVDVRAVRVAGTVREAVVLAMGGDPFDHRPSTAVEPRTAISARTARVVLTLRCVNSR